ncbi:MAG: hypothetical protein A3J58_02730 [Candidatus Sungbacteria bacterium RIFCSPHIGHO2_02_FULL_52_23]|uniref:Uncharacterized protein n=1 Tax=Candidatus Sungbacteria bacterium RIFCSPHIGHO2_02_FULL_52_23 TaxID=1802274 RepID=A0A1G2KSP7_9BACT|nr:MAG: hypothetical protein A3J58_02730 [Candidatus Sungbacteria bacterium RIFCSPHIGHO2_02_FULL_52_23]
MDWLKTLSSGVLTAVSLLAGLALLAGFLLPVANDIYVKVGTGNNAMTIVALALVILVSGAGVSWMHTHPQSNG